MRKQEDHEFTERFSAAVPTVQGALQEESHPLMAEPAGDHHPALLLLNLHLPHLRHPGGDHISILFHHQLR